MKKIRFLGLGLLLGLCGVLILVFVPSDTKVSVSASSEIREITIENVSQELFGDVKIKSTEYLYNYDDSADYIYVNFANYGYAIYFQETMEIMEYTPSGELRYLDTRARKYYGGPTNYLNKIGEQFVNTVTKESFFVSSSEAITYSKGIREALKNKDAFKNDIQIEENSGDAITRAGVVMRTNVPSHLPNDETIPADLPGSTGTVYISNAEYFETINWETSYGKNSSTGGVPGTCGAVAVQMLLNYNNYYNDRRLIANNYLYAAKEENPNTCTDPTSMTEYTLGSRSENTGGNSYFAYVRSKGLSGGTMPASLYLGLNSILYERSQQIAGISAEITHDALYAPYTPYVENEINAERPVIISMAQSIGGLDHYVVGYGYQNLNSTYTNNTTQFGYIVNYGWSFYDSNSWINAKWCDYYVSLKINHTHGYYDTGVAVGSKRELKCSECNHRIAANITTVTTAQQLINIKNSPVGYYKLGNNITLSGQWTTIPNFYGVLDGNTFAINNMTFDIPDTKYTKAQYFGLFGFLFGTVSNLKMQNVAITSGIRHDGEWVDVGGIAGQIVSTGKIENSSVSGSLHTRRLNCNTGGIAGANHGKISNCTSTATLYTNGDTGGIAGRSMSTGTITNSINSGDVSFYLSSSARSVGGVVGLNEGTFTNNKHSGHIKATNTINLKACMGTIIGHHRTSTAFSTTNTVNGGTYTMPSYTSGNNVYLFAQHNTRVGRVG